ncbi:MAG: adenosine deaminase family protein [Spirochaetales bacterium]|nr:adenosine deaminase family protein [Spirochaetales bacterium]
MAWYTDDFLKALPKTDLHVHLDGSLRLQTLIDLAHQKRVSLPSYTLEGLNELVFKPHYKNLEEYLQGFAYTTAVMQDFESLERVAYELALDNAAEGVKYLEVRFAPQLHMSSTLDFGQVMEAVDKGLRRGKSEINQNLDPQDPEFEFGIIVCAMRYFNQHFSEYYRDFTRAHRFSTEKEVIRYASLELAKAAVTLSKTSNIQLVAFDLAGSEYGYPASAHEDSYDLIHKSFLKKTVHAGEAYGAESIFQAVTDLHADRIGHGLHLFDESSVKSPQVTNKETYIRGLVDYIADRRTTLEVCLTSNLQTVPAIRGSIQNHSLGRMLENNLSITLCTDNRLVSHTTVTDELKLALDTFAIGPKELRNIIVYGFKRSFYFHPYPEKRKWVRKVIDMYDRVAKEHDVRS